MTVPLQINRYDRLVRRLGNVVGERAIVTGVLEDVFPTIDVEDLQTDGWAVAGWRPAMGGGLLTGAAGERPHVQIHNPNGSGVLTVVEDVFISTNANSRIDFNIHDAVLTTLQVSNRWRDRRFPTLNFPVTQVRSQSIVGSPIVSVMSQFVRGNETIIWVPPKGVMVLIPGTGLAFSNVNAATQLSVNFFWRERAIEPAEENI